MGSIIDNSTIESESMSAELGVLYMLQYEALQKSSYLRMSEKEAEVYDRRRIRIGDLCDKLAELRASVC
jgi:hypothetical protein